MKVTSKNLVSKNSEKVIGGMEAIRNIIIFFNLSIILCSPLACNSLLFF